MRDTQELGEALTQGAFEGLRHTQRTILNKVTPSGPGWAQGLGKHILILVITERYKVLLDKLGPLEVLKHISLKDTGVMGIQKARGV